MNREHGSAFWHLLDLLDIFDAPILLPVVLLAALCAWLALRAFGGREVVR